ncbi:unnamed protein product, partial [marine sediment metagenome]
TDKYTVVIESKFFNAEWWQQLSGLSGEHIPPEVVEAGPNDWDNLVGTGPFMIKEHKPGVCMTYVRNPNYWDTTTINGIEYEIPFIDELVHPFIADISTLTAAIRTATLDVYWYVTNLDAANLRQTTPELLSAPGGGGWVSTIILRTDRSPLDDINVRRALMIGTNLEAVHKATLRVGPPFYSWPVQEGIPGHVPLEELPPDIRELFEYNPKKARQMLADAGYPDGFTLELLQKASFDLPMDEIGQVVASMWAEDLNIKTEFKAVEG